MEGFVIVEWSKCNGRPAILMHRDDLWCVYRSHFRFFYDEQEARTCFACMLRGCHNECQT